MTAETILLSLHLSAPELILAVGALVLLMVGVFSGERSGLVVTGLAIVLLLASGLWLLFVPAEGLAYGGVYMADGFSRFMKLVALIGSLVALFMVEPGLAVAGLAGIERFQPFARGDAAQQPPPHRRGEAKRGDEAIDQRHAVAAQS